MDLKEKIDISRLPRHVAIIMDGNGRWAKQQGKARVFGHQNGIKPVREITEAAAELGIEYLTLYAFSTENWNRPAIEVNALMQLLVTTIRKETKTLNKNNIRLLAIGDIDNLPSSCKKELLKTIEETAQNTRMSLVLALNYSAKWEILNAVKQIAKQVEQKEISIDSIDANVFSNNLTTKNIPDPDLLIRTSGEERISNFLLWQLAYSELLFTPVLWPDFSKEEFYKTLINYQERERRFGLTSEQIKK